MKKIDNRPNLAAMLRHEELETKRKAQEVMSRIMAVGNSDIKVSSLKLRYITQMLRRLLD